MERVENYRGKKCLILKTLERCFGHRFTSTVKHRVAPGGYFSVYVGSNKERFVIKVECTNHPLFKNLLDEAEMVYGFKSEGPLELPCDVDLFHQVLCEIDQEMMASPFTKVWLRQVFWWISASRSSVHLVSWIMGQFWAWSWSAACYGAVKVPSLSCSI